MENKALVSVIITNYNKGKLLTRALNSVKEQIGAEDEIVLVDDCSTSDLDKDILNKLENELSNSNIRLIRNPTNLGVSRSKNKGVYSSLNDVIVLLDGDDYLPLGAIGAIRSAFENDESIGFIYGNYNHYLNGEFKEQVDCSVVTTDEELDLCKLAHNWRIHGSSPFRKSRVFTDFRFDPNYNRTDDVDFHRQLFLSGIKTKYCDALIYNWMQESDGNNSNIPMFDRLGSKMKTFGFSYRYMTKLSLVKFTLRIQFELLSLLIKKLINSSK